MNKFVTVVCLFTVFTCYGNDDSFNSESKKIIRRDIQYNSSSSEYNRSISTTDTNRNNVIEHQVKPFDMMQLNANTIQNIYISPIRDKCFVGFIKPQYATIASYAAPSQYKDGNIIKGFGATSISDKELRQIYSIFREKKADKDSILFILNIFHRVNNDNCRIIYYGKDTYDMNRRRNTVYIYKLGFEDRGIVLFFPDEFKGIFNGTWKDPTRLGWNVFWDNFIDILQRNNKHVSFKKIREDNEEIYVLRFQDFKGE